MSRRLSAVLAALLSTPAVLLPPLRADAMVCSFTSIVGVSFGNYNVYSAANVDGAGSMTYLCDTGVASFVTIDISTGSSGSYLARTMKNGTSALSYNLYSAPARTGNPWGDGTNNTTHYGPVLVVLGASTTLNVYGRIPGSQGSAKSGVHNDTVVLTINF